MFKPEAVRWLRQELRRGKLSRSALGRGLCERDGWRNRQGRFCKASARKALPQLASELGLDLPPARAGPSPGRRPAAGEAWAGPSSSAVWIAWGRCGYVWRARRRSADGAGACWRAPIRGRAPGSRLRYLLEADCGALGVLSFVAAPLRLGPRDEHLGWDARTRGEDI